MPNILGNCLKIFGPKIMGNTGKFIGNWAKKGKLSRIDEKRPNVRQIISR